MKTPSARNVLGQPSWRLANSAIEAFLTVQGGHLGPTTFDRQNSKIQPIEQESPDGIVLIDTQGKSVRVPFDLNRIQNSGV